MFKLRQPDLVEAPVKALLGPALAWAVADTLGYLERGEMHISTFTSKPGFLPLFTRKYNYRWPSVRGHKFDPLSSDGLARYIVVTICEKMITSIRRNGSQWIAKIGDVESSGGTFDLAVLRCYVLAMKKGEFVKVPSEFVQ
jgi:hypothetical protein